MVRHGFLFYTMQKTIWTAITLAAICLPVWAQSKPAAPVTVRFSGYEWEVREQTDSGPGPNNWKRENVWVDKSGALHLRISRDAKGKWHCAELTTAQKFGNGTYTFETVGRIDRFDKNVVLGLFDYPTYGEDPDATNEIDIEFARWGNAAYPNGNFTVYPATGKRGKNDSFTFEYSLAGMPDDVVTTHRFTRSAKSVMLETLAQGKSLAQWTFAPTDTRLVPQKPLAVHINLWLFGGVAPSDSKPVEVVVRGFVFAPAH